MKWRNIFSEKTHGRKAKSKNTKKIHLFPYDTVICKKKKIVRVFQLEIPGKKSPPFDILCFYLSISFYFLFLLYIFPPFYANYLNEQAIFFPLLKIVIYYCYLFEMYAYKFV